MMSSGPSAPHAHGKTLQLGDVVLERPVDHRSRCHRRAGGEDIDGLIGYEMFSRVAVRIDYPGLRLALTAPSAFTPP